METAICTREKSEQLHIVVETIACNMPFNGILNHNKFSLKINRKQQTEYSALCFGAFEFVATFIVAAYTK